jgi:hypothetical protein
MKKNLFLLSLLLSACSGMQKSGETTHMQDGKMLRLELKNPPILGTTSRGQRIYLGGFSGLRYLGKIQDGKLRFLTHTDRGPNADELEEKGKTKRPFLLSNFQPRLVYLLADPLKGTLEIEKEILLQRPDGKKLSGMPQMEGQEIPVDTEGRGLTLDPYGMDLEGVAASEDGTFWMVEEYGPSIAHFSASGKLLGTLKPGSGLPKVLENRRLNRGFEGMDLFGSRLYTILQSPLKKESSLVRLVEVDTLKRRTLGQYAYILSEGAEKIGDLAATGPREFLVIERGGDAIRKVFRASIEGVTNLQYSPEKISGAKLETMSAQELAEAKVVAVNKTELVDLTALGMNYDKLEGLDLVNDDWLAVVNDNDFSLSGGIDRLTGSVEFKEEASYLYLIHRDLWKK